MPNPNDIQAKIDAIFAGSGSGALAPAPTDRIVANARIGVETPAALSPDAIAEICRSLLIYFAQMGID